MHLESCWRWDQGSILPSGLSVTAGKTPPPKGTHHRPAHQGNFFLSLLPANTQSVTFTRGKKSLIGYFQDYFLWMDNIKAGCQTGKPLTDFLLSEIRNVWIPSLNPSKYFHEPVQALCKELNPEIIPQSSEHLQQVGRQEQQSRAETLGF